MDIFPRKPILDRIIVREIPIAEYYEQPEGVDIDLDNKHIKERSDRGVVVAVGNSAWEILQGDVVFFDEFALADPVYLNPAHKNRVDLPRYFQIRMADLKGFDVEVRAKVMQQLAASPDCNCLQAPEHHEFCKSNA